MHKKIQQRLKSMERRHLIAACVAVVVLAAGIVAATVLLVNRPQSPNNSATEDFSISGELACLPHKDTSGPQTLECAYGLRTDDNRYYALQFNPYPIEAEFGSRAKIRGTLTTGGDSIYRIEGTISVKDFESL